MNLNFINKKFLYVDINKWIISLISNFKFIRVHLVDFINIK